MHILVMPVSGGGFASQLGIMQHLCEINYKPDITLASSGGNVAAYVASAAKWNWPSIERISKNLTQEMFIKKWNTISSLALIYGYFKGNIYNQGYGVKEFLKNNFNEETIIKDEIWTGTYNKNKQKAQLFCNKEKKNSLIDINYIDYDLTQSLKPIYSNGNIDLIAKSCIASASIPAIVPAQKIDKEYYIDGGIAGATPLKILQEPILKKVDKDNSSLHIFYINSLDLSSPNLTDCKNVLDIWRQATHDLVRSQNVIDRLACYEIIRCKAGFMNKEEFICTYKNMKRIKKIQTKVLYSFVEIFPLKNYDVDIINFNGDDVINSINLSYNNSKCRIWWKTPTPNISSYEIFNILQKCKQNS